MVVMRMQYIDIQGFDGDLVGEIRGKEGGTQTGVHIDYNFTVLFPKNINNKINDNIVHNIGV